MIIPLTTACILAASQTYYLEPKTLYGILAVEGGWEGLAKKNANGTEDLNRFQINTTWIPTFRAYWRLTSAEATYEILRDNGCASAYAAGAIVRYHLQRTGDLERAIGMYHTGPGGSAAEAARYLKSYHYVLENGRLPPKRSSRPFEPPQR